MLNNIKVLFGKYLPKDKVNEICNNTAPCYKTMDVTSVRISVINYDFLFSEMELGVFVNYLNKYYEVVMDTILEYNGFISEFYDGKILAYWGVPVPDKKHVEMAVKCAIKIIDKLIIEKQSLLDIHKVLPEVGIAINTGHAICGFVGSNKIKGYTVLGDAVNLASRLESLNKNYPNETNEEKSIIISEFTYQQVKDIFEVKYLDEVKVKGKDIGVKIYKVIGIKGDTL